MGQSTRSASAALGRPRCLSARGRLALGSLVISTLLAVSPLAAHRVSAASSYSVTTFPEQGYSPSALAVNSGTDMVYMANDDSFDLNVVDGAHNTISATIALPTPYSTGVALNPDTNTVYVTSQPSSSYSGAVSVIDGNTNSVTATIALADPRGVAVDPGTATVYVTDYGQTSTLKVINASTNAVTTTIPVGSAAANVAVDQSTDKVYVTNTGSGTVSVIDGATDMVSATIDVGGAPSGVAVDPSSDTIYVADSSTNTVSVIDGSTNTVAAAVATYAPEGVAVDPATGAVYVSNFFNSTVSVIGGTTSPSVIATVEVGADPVGVAVNTANHSVYVADSGSSSISAIAVRAITSTSLTSSASPTEYGTPVILTATTQGRLDGGGSVTFSVGGVQIPGCAQVELAVDNSQASCSYSQLPVGTDKITANYSGDATANPSEASIIQVVDRAPTVLEATPAVLLLKPPTPELMTLMATLSVHGQALAGQQVLFTAGNYTLCTRVSDSSGRASCPILGDPPALVALLRAGNYQASYAGSIDYLPSSATAGLIG